ncbi:hypothetical protein EW093_14945 [Thiospirochaeta perfilievii]|uniref:Lipoprotein n=1 Tax=Thiospirochaeta perfilievii TaxID=252967 RepID=A0A5C1QH89_9SPIO|nr:hypothetical protein [Thiospirochaeta perfilievii]QEN05936.1 hypothetical protein EW093_14945 [Thiospirochaeta perfilievii]
MKTILKIVTVVSILVFTTACVTKEEPRVAGELPRKWWTMDVDPLENLYRSSADGVETRVKLFIAISDEPTNATEVDAIEDANMKVAVQVSRYLALLVTNISQSAKFNDYVKQVVQDSSVEGGKVESVVNEIKNQTNNFSAMITTTQFSSMKVIGSHAEKVKGSDNYKGWVCVSMTDDILEQTQKLQEAAFKTILELNPDYKQIIADINTEITRSIKENITDNTELR